MDELRLALIGLGIFAIAGIMAHGMWTIRKNKRKTDDTHQEIQSDVFEEPQISISEDDPLLAPMPRKTAAKEQVLNDRHTDEPIDAVQTVTEKPAVFEDDLLVGDRPLYDESDLQVSPGAKHRVAPEVDDIPAFVATPQEGGQDYDQDGIGEVRVVDKPVVATTKKASLASETHEEQTAASLSDIELPEPPSSLLINEPVAPSVGHSRDHADMEHDSIPMIDTSIDIDDMPHGHSEHGGKKSGALKSEHTRTEVVGGKKAKSESIAERARKLVGRGSDAKKTEPKKRKGPAPAKDQIRLDLEASEDAVTTDDNHTEVPQQEQEVLILNVKVPEGKVIQGAVLLPTLLTLGFKFGEHNMFHRHAASNGKGPKLFTLANMYNPGTFDIDNMENFNTTGVSLFMILPIEADAHQVFNMMHNAARKMADEFGAQVLDGRRSVLTKQSLQQYVEKIREFERKRMIRRA